MGCIVDLEGVVTRAAEPGIAGVAPNGVITAFFNHENLALARRHPSSPAGVVAHQNMLTVLVSVGDG
ncbi:hypothetical protein HLB35_14720 [Halomonas sp. TBZ9]|uniref:Uncharacterized protein n=1 Tax=Vreelandella azerica TaxID=2732867 RepID=A0A7Y3XBU2_9GAMM|nr:hypothetical protein [Halomonas azerica]NOG32698.1 hypothetical protein [Halomonas azerica]